MTPKERAAMQQALDALELAKGSHGVMLMSDPPHDAWKFRGCDFKLMEAITALREALAEQAEQKPVAKTALKNCIYFDSIDFNQTPPYLRYDTGDSTPKENWTIYCDIQEELRKNGYELTDSDVDHDTVCGDVTPIEAPVRTKDLTDGEIADALYGKGCWRLGVHPVHLREYRRVIQADRELNK